MTSRTPTVPVFDDRPLYAATPADLRRWPGAYDHEEYAPEHAPTPHDDGLGVWRGIEVALLLQLLFGFVIVAFSF